ncbi:Guanylate-binding protein 5 [Branchiostoma belcheri]|nr:Guanylate-binding protein 5 [Branchiostoma belcheri]
MSTGLHEKAEEDDENNETSGNSKAQTGGEELQQPQIKSALTAIDWIPGYADGCAPVNSKAPVTTRLGFRTEVVLTTHGYPAFAHVFARREHAGAPAATMESLQGNSLSRRNKLYLKISQSLTEDQADGKFGKGNLGLLKDLLRALDETRLAKEVEDLERDQMQRDISLLHSKLGFKVEELKPPAGRETVQGSSIPLILPNDMKYNAATGGVEKVRGAQRTSLHVVPEALALLEGIQEPVSVLAICGPCRTGKSYILSRLLGSADAFELGHSMDPQTFGIWMGTKVLRGKDFTIVLLDTEGIDTVGASAGQDASILVLTILLSSQLIYNSQNVPYKGDLEKMQCFIRLAKGVTVKQGEKKIQTSLFRQFFPDFLWLLRDVSLDMKDEDGKEMVPSEYLKTKVLARDPDDFEESQSEKVGRAILTFFPSVECTTLERPSGDNEVMKNIAQHTDSLNPNFNKGVNTLIEQLLHNARAKRGYNKASTVSGLALSIMVERYVEAVNDPNSIPALDNTWQNTVQLLRGRAVEEVIDEYNQQMQAKVATATNNWRDPLEECPENGILLKPVTSGRGGKGAEYNTRNPPSQPTLIDLHNELLNKVTGMLLEKVGHFGIRSEERSYENENLIDQMQKRLAEDGSNRKQKGFVVIGGELLRYIQQNKKHSNTFCQELFERLLEPIRKHVESPPKGYDFQQLLGELDKARQLYNEQARGPEKWIVLQEMTQNIEKLKTNFEKIDGYQRAMKREMEEKHLVALQKIQDLHAAKMEQQAKIERERSAREASGLKDTIKEVEEQLADMKKEQKSCTIL